MTASDLQNALTELRIDFGTLIALTGASRVTVWRWLNGRTPVPAHVATLLEQQQRLIALARQLVEVGHRPCVSPLVW